jgi:hypothetical protein
MKKILVATIIGLAATASVMAQGRIFLWNYDVDNSTGPQVFQLNGSTPIAAGPGYTVGIYFKLGAGNTFTDATGYADPTTAAWTLGTGAGSTAVFNGPGYFLSGSEFGVPGTSATTSTTVSFIVVAYNGADYATSTIRGHSAAFNQATAVNTDAANGVFGGMQAFQMYNVAAVPEPSTFALAGLGLAGLLIFRRRK